VANLVRSDGRAELSHTLQEPVSAGQMIVNLRAEGDPEHLRRQVSEILDMMNRERSLGLKVEHLESFRPGKPTPTHRLAAV
jgi:hypothetical protein